MVLTMFTIGNTLVVFQRNQWALISNECPSEVKGKTFLEWASIGLSSKLSLTCEGNVNYYKSVHHLISALLGSFQNKSVNSPFNWVSRYILYLAKLKGRGKLFLEGARRGPHCEITHKDTWLSQEMKKPLFGEIGNNPTPSLSLFRSPYK